MLAAAALALALALAVLLTREGPPAPDPEPAPELAGPAAPEPLPAPRPGPSVEPEPEAVPEAAAPVPAELPASVAAQVEALALALGPEHPAELRAWAAHQLGALVRQSAEAQERLIEALDDPDARVVGSAARSLSRSQQPAAREALLRLRRHPEPRVRGLADALVQSSR